MELASVYVEIDSWPSQERLCVSGKDFQSRFSVFRMSLALLLSSGESDRLPLLCGVVLEA